MLRIPFKGFPASWAYARKQPDLVDVDAVCQEIDPETPISLK